MDEGAQFMFNRGPPTTNVKMCFTFADGDTTKGRVFVYNSGGGINNSPIAPYTGALRMQVDKDTRIQCVWRFNIRSFANSIHRLEEKNLAQARGQLEALQQQSSERHDEVNKCKAQLQDHERQKKHLKLASQTASRELERLEIELEKATPDEAAIQVRESELAEAQQELKNSMNFYEDVVTRKIELNDENRANKQEMEAAQKLVADLRSRLDKAHLTVRTLQGTREEELKEKNKAIEQVAEAENVKKNWQEELLESQQSLAEVTEGATSICERVFVPPNSTSEDLQRRMVQMAKTREEAERELGGSQLDLTRAATEAKQKHHDAMKEFEDIRGLRNVSLITRIIMTLADPAQQLITTLDNRRNRWKQFRSGISVRARVTFNYLLSERKFRGTLSIDHKKALLDIHVSLDISSTRTRR